MAGGFKAIRGGVAGGRAVASYFGRGDCGAAAGYYVEGENVTGVVTVARWEAGAGRAGVRMCGAVGLDRDSYAVWLAGFDPDSGEARGAHRKGDVRESVLAWEHAVTVSKTLSIAAALDPEVASALTGAFDDATAAVAGVVTSRGVVRAGPRGRQVQVPVAAVETGMVDHFSSRAGDPHRHRHLQVNARVLVELDGERVWRAVDSRALLKGLIGEVNEAERAAICGHAGLRRALAAKGWQLNVDGEVEHFTPAAKALSKRSSQITANVAGLEAGWREAHPGEEPPAATVRSWDQRAWGIGREAKDPALTVDALRARAVEACGRVGVDWLRGDWGEDLPDTAPPVAAERLAATAVDGLAAGQSAWNAGQVHAAVDKAMRLSGWWGSAEARTMLHEAAAGMALAGCVSILPEQYAASALVQSKHLTSPRVIAEDARLHAELARLAGRAGGLADIGAAAAGLDVGQAAAAGLVAGTCGLGVVEGVAGAGKTRMLVAAQQALRAQGRAMIVVTPTLKAASVARGEGIEAASSVHKLLHAQGWRWDDYGHYTRLAAGQVDPHTGRPWAGPGGRGRILAGSVVVVDEAGMLDVPTALALIDVVGEAGAGLRLVGDRAQLAAVGRGGVLDAGLKHVDDDRRVEITTAHRFRVWDPTRGEWATNVEYAELAARIRRRDNPAETFRAMSVGVGSAIRIAADLDGAYDQLAAAVAADPAHLVIAATNSDVAEINARARALLVASGVVDDTAAVGNADNVRVSVGDHIVTRRNDPDIGVANREIHTVVAIGGDGSIVARVDHDSARLVTLPAGYVTGRAGDGTAFVQHAYATTGHGAQGATVDDATVLVTDATDAAGLYVGVTRGRLHNRVVVVAATEEQARSVWAAAATKVRADAGIGAARQAAVDEIRGEGMAPPAAADGPAPLTAVEVAEAAAICDERILPQLADCRQWITYRRQQQQRAEAAAAWITAHVDPAGLRGRAEAAVKMAGRTEAEAAARCEARVTQATTTASQDTGRALYQVGLAAARLDRAGILHRRQARHEWDVATGAAAAIAPTITPPADWGHHGQAHAWQRQVIDQAAEEAGRPTSVEHLLARAAAASRQEADRYTAQAAQADTALGEHLGPEPASPRTVDRSYRWETLARLEKTAGRLQRAAEKLNPQQADPDVVRDLLQQIRAGDQQQAEQARQHEAETTRNHQLDYTRRATPNHGPGIGR